jgi:hypothetical protein
MKVEEVGHAALSGWRQRVADGVAERAPTRGEKVRAALGLLFLGLTLRHLVTTARRLYSRS